MQMPQDSPTISQPDTLVDTISLQQLPTPSSANISRARHPSVTFVPIAPLHYNRYDRQRYIERVPKDYIVHPVSRIIHREPLAEWIPHEHPEGALYFRHREKNIFTDVDLYDPEAMKLLTICKEQILRRPRANWILGSSTVDLVLDILSHDKDSFKCAYYFVDHAERLVFWIDDFSMNKLVVWRAMPGITTATHVKIGLEIEYWRHIDYFPSTLPVSHAVLKELRDHVVFSLTDTITSPTSILSTPTEYFFQILSVVDALGTDLQLGSTRANAARPIIIDTAWGVVVGRFMKEFVRMKFNNFNGEVSARLDSSNSVYGSVYQTSYLFNFTATILFNAPHPHLTNIQTMYRDGILDCRGWKDFIRNLRSEWQETILFGTLILNANVGFLAISSGTMVLTLLVQTLSYISVLFSLGSILTGMLLSRQYRQQDREAGLIFMDIAVPFFQRRSIIGLEPLAMLYSLPYGFMIWGMITFLLAFLTMAIQSTTDASRWLVVTIFAVIFVSALGHLTAEDAIRFYRKWIVPRMSAGGLHGILPI